MRTQAIAAAMVVAAPLLVLGSPQVAACWDTAGYGIRPAPSLRPSPRVVPSPLPP